MARRISSILSIGSSNSDKTQSSSSTESKLSSSIHPARTSVESNSYAKLTANSLSESRLGDNVRDLPLEQGLGISASSNPSLSPRIDEDQPILQSPHLLSPIPIDTTSPNGRRSASVDNTYQHAPLMKPLPMRSESSSSSKPVSGEIYPDNHPGSQVPSRPGSPIRSRPQTPTKDANLRRRRSWLPGKSKSEAEQKPITRYDWEAWIVTPQQQFPYDITPLANLEKVPELWDESGDALVYLHGQEHGRGPSFKVDSSIFSSSKSLTLAAHGATHTTVQREQSDIQHRPSVDRAQHLTVNAPFSPPVSRPGSPGQSSSKGSRSISDFFDDTPVKKDVHLSLSLPLKMDLSNPQAKPTADDIETLLTMRNLFAFLAGKSLVATPNQPSIFTMFMSIADVLQRYEFTNLDGSTLGEEAAMSFRRIFEDFALADVRSSREKTIEAIVLGERMRSSTLYNEGFVHAIGKYEDISRLGSSKYNLISGVTRKRLERAHLDLSARLRNIRTRLNDFDFPSLFAGVANSTTSAESKIIHFKDWKNSYMAMRRHVINLYKSRYGAWPPKAKSKKNDFEESGLNRLLLLEVYQDFSDLYDVLVDRKAQTTRSVDISSEAGPDVSEKPRVRALRRVLDEYDRSTPPVQPPVPFDIPLQPSLSNTRRGFDALDPKRRAKENTQKLQDDEINLALMQSYNRDSIKSTPFLEAFMAFERRSAKGKSMDEIADLRDGQWLFMYAVLESLPLLVVDAPGVQWAHGVEYFLCEVPKGSVPWVQENPSRKQSWYGVAGGAGMVSLPADIVEHGVEGIYHRSHCWQVAEKWTGFSGGVIPSQPQVTPPLKNEGLLSPALPPSPDSRSGSPMAGNRRRASSIGGLEHLPLPPGVVLSGSRPASIHSHDPSKTFGTILAQTEVVVDKKKK